MPVCDSICMHTAVDDAVTVASVGVTGLNLMVKGDSDGLQGDPGVEARYHELLETAVSAPASNWQGSTPLQPSLDLCEISGQTLESCGAALLHCLADSDF